MVYTPEELILEATDYMTLPEECRNMKPSSRIYQWLETNEIANLSEIIALNHGINPYNLIFDEKGKPKEDLTFLELSKGIERLVSEQKSIA